MNPAPSQWKVRRYPVGVQEKGKRYRMGDGSNYTVAKDGAIVSTDPPQRSKKERNRLKREARRATQ